MKHFLIVVDMQKDFVDAFAQVCGGSVTTY